MKPVRLTTALLIGLALMSNGCDSLSPSAANSPTWQQEMKQEQPNKNVAQGNYDYELLYWILYFGGQSLANKY
jgi:hypothetical protein